MYTTSSINTKTKTQPRVTLCKTWLSWTSNQEKISRFPNTSDKRRPRFHLNSCSQFREAESHSLNLDWFSRVSSTKWPPT